MKDYELFPKFCKGIFYAGGGNFWYEEGVVGDDTTFSYKAYCFTLYLMFAVMTVLEIMAATIGDFPEQEKSDALALGLGHIVISIKLYLVISNRSVIKKMIYDLVQVCELYEDASMMARKYKDIKITIILYIMVVYGAMFFIVVEGLVRLTEGLDYIAVPTYFPAHDDHSIFAVCLRVFMTLDCSIYMIPMILIADMFAVINLVVFKYKFKTLRHYIENLGVEMSEMSHLEQIILASENLKNGLIKGIQAHNELIRLSVEFDNAFGTMIAMQIAQSSGTAITLMLQITIAGDFTIVTVSKALLFITCLYLQLGLLLCNAGEITYQASLLTDSFFYSGWCLCPASAPAHRDLRRIVTLACAQAQRPLIMKAFKMFELTYVTFLSAVRGSYSLFTLLYTQKQ